ncbi:MAG TPA: YfiR family protein [Thermoanaerobaculia bacterium]
MAVLKRSLAAPLLLAAALLAAPGAVRAQVAAEYDVKAAFLYNFTKFVEWPPSAFIDDGSSLKLCVLGEDPFGKSLQTVAGEEVAGRKLTVLAKGTLPDPAICQILFISRSERERLSEILSGVRGRPVLTVSDTKGFLDQGGIINFTLEGTKVRFEINQESAERSGLKISSKLLRLATRVVPGPRPGP